jgi:hypothetical protein
MNEFVNLPFYPPDKTLKEIIEKKYLYDIAKWLLGDANDDMILARKSNSLWESALSIIFFSEVIKIDSFNIELKNNIKYKIPVVVRWLIGDSQLTFLENEDYVNWENVTWDTAVIIRAILISLKLNNEESYTDNEKSEIIKISRKATLWLLNKFTEWDKEVKYPFGPADLSQIIITILLIHNEFSELSNEIINDIKNNDKLKLFFINCDNLIDIAEEISKYLLYIKEKDYDNKKEIQYCWWDDYFTTSEVIEGLSAFYNLCNDDSNLLPKYKKTIEEIATTTVCVCVYFEKNQANGMWGSHIDTLKVIYAYLSIAEMKRVHSKKKLIEPEIHTTFKAIRWICDEKQVFKDGSFMHTMFLSIFYSHALIKVYNNWSHVNQNIYELYDDVVWSSPVRTTPERSKRLSEEMKNEKLKLEMKKKKEKLLDMYSLSMSFVVVATIIIIMNNLDIIDITIEINSKSYLIAFATGGISLIMLVVGIINKKLRGKK